MLYAISFSALVLTILISLLYVNYQLSNYPQFVIKKDIMITLAEHVSPDIWLINILGTVYIQLSMISFVSTWLATVLLLKHYSKRIGIIKYWALVCIPVIYFFFPFFAQSFGIFEQLRLTFAHRFELIYSIMFAPYKQVGGLLFGMVFLTASSAVRRSEIKVSLLITAAGVILLFGSNIVNGLAVLVSPPFGIVAISYMGLASFLLLTGLMVFTKYTAKDIVIRKELHKSINNDAHLLKNLSLAEIERDIAVKVKPLMEKSINAEKEAYEYDIAEGDIKEILQEVLQELHDKQKDP